MSQVINRIIDLKTRYGEDSDIVKEQYEIIDYLIKKDTTL